MTNYKKLIESILKEDVAELIQVDGTGLDFKRLHIRSLYDSEILLWGANYKDCYIQLLEYTLFIKRLMLSGDNEEEKERIRMHYEARMNTLTITNNNK